MPAREIDTAYVAILPNTSGFRPALQRELDATFAGASQRVSMATTEMDRQFRQAGTDMGSSFASGAVRSEAAVSGLASEVNHQMNRIDTNVATTTHGMSQKFSVAALAIQGALFGVGVAAVGGLAKLTTMGLQSAAAMEQVQISFNALLGSAEEGQKVFNQLQQFAAVTPFQFQDVAGAAKRFLAFAQSVGLTRDQLQDYLTTIGNVISVTGGGAEAFQRVGLAIGQIGGASKVTLDNLNQIADAIPGFSPIQAIASSLGITTAEAMKQISAGALPAAQGVQALLKGMQQFPGAAGAMEKQSQTLLGVWSTFKDTFSITLTQAFQPTIPAIKGTLDKLTPVLGDALGKIAPLLGQTLAAVLPLLANVIQAIVPILQPVLDAFGPALAALGPVLLPLGQALGQLLTPLEPLIVALGPLAVILAEVLTPAIQLVALVLKPLEPLFTFLGRAVGEFARWLSSINWGQVGSAIGHGFAVAWQAVVRFFDGIGHFFADLPGKIGRFLKSVPDLLGNLIKAWFNRSVEMVGVGIGLLIAEFTTLPKLVVGELLKLDVEATKALGGMLLHLGVVMLHGIEALGGFLLRLPSMALDALVSLGPLLVHLIGEAFDRAKDRAINALRAIVTFVASIPTRLIGFAADVGTGIVHFITGAINHVIDKLNDGIGHIDAVIPGDLPRLPHLAHGGISFGPALIGENASTVPEAAIPLGDPAALRMLRAALGGGGPTINVAPGGIVVNVNGGTMTPQQGQAVGEQIAAGIAASTAIRTAVRTA